ncbi:hypothetical protein ABN028_24655 [Actinopolymorpha sp. B17G11]|uniref:hypothetical protein n=1 Tax=Actinopolymorpha sp. B17G11 TaxID=3160861 RepID=UPI0032E51D23
MLTLAPLALILIGVALLVGNAFPRRVPTWPLVAVAIALSFAIWSIAGDVQTS